MTTSGPYEGVSGDDYVDVSSKGNGGMLKSFRILLSLEAYSRRWHECGHENPKC
jgi:hypothetical protein